MYGSVGPGSSSASAQSVLGKCRNHRQKVSEEEKRNRHPCASVPTRVTKERREGQGERVRGRGSGGEGQGGSVLVMLVSKAQHKQQW